MPISEEFKDFEETDVDTLDTEEEDKKETPPISIKEEETPPITIKEEEIKVKEDVDAAKKYNDAVVNIVGITDNYVRELPTSMKGIMEQFIDSLFNPYLVKTFTESKLFEIIYKTIKLIRHMTYVMSIYNTLAIGKHDRNGNGEIMVDIIDTMNMEYFIKISEESDEQIIKAAKNIMKKLKSNKKIYASNYNISNKTMIIDFHKKHKSTM